MANRTRHYFAFGFVWFLILIHDSNSFNLGLISGDLKRTLKPLIIKKTAHHSPVIINIKSGIPNLPPVVIPKLPKKPFLTKLKAKKKPLKPLRLRKLTKLPKLLKAPKLTKTPKIPKLPKLPKIPKSPKIPKLPLLPLLPPLLPPLIPKLPLLPLLPIFPPLPLLPPILPKLPKLSKPLRIPLISKIGLNALGSEIRPVTVPAPDLKKKILEKLLKLRRDGSLTTAEFIRFKKLLL